MANIFHIITKKDWALAEKKGVYSPESLKSEGFIHCSQTDQILDVVNHLYKGSDQLLLLRIVEEKITAEVKHELPVEAPWSGVIYPHIYGVLNLDSVEKVIEFLPESSGLFVLPKDLLK